MEAVSDTVEVSPRIAELQKFVQAGEQVSDVRTETVEAIKAQIQNGEYHVEAEAVAEALIEGGILGQEG